MSLALSNCVLFISFMESLNGTKFLNITFISPFFAAPPAPAVFAIYTVPLSSVYKST